MYGAIGICLFSTSLWKWTPDPLRPQIQIFKERDRPDRLRDHAGRVQRWESVCWGVLAIPLLENSKNKKIIFITSTSRFCRMSISCFIFVNFPFSISHFYFQTCWYIGLRFSTFRFPYLQQNIFSKMCPICSHIIRSVSVINKGSEGQYLVSFLKAPKSSNKYCNPSASLN